MIILRATYLVLCLLALSLVARAQVDTTAVDSIAVDTTALSQPVDSLAADSVKELFRVFPWKYHASLTSDLVSSDSSLRWQIWPNWTYKKNRDPGVITYRLGTIERGNAFLIHAQEPRYQRLKWEDISLNDPVSGTVYWDLIPQHKIKAFYEEDQGLYYDSNYFLKQYYLNKPLTKLNYDESKFDYRSLEFTVSQNFSQKTNAEISYWDRRGGGEYNNSNVAGRQIFARIFHQLDHRQALKLNFLNNKYTIGEPFGYRIPDLDNFAFNRFLASAEESGAQSEIKATTLSLNYYRRGEDTTRVADDLHVGLYLNNRSRSLEYSGDSTFYQVRSYGANARKWVDLNPLKVEGGVSYEFFTNKDRPGSSLTRDTWGLLTADAEAVFSPLNFTDLKGGVSYKSRSDGYHSYSISAGFKADTRIFQLSANASRGTAMPTIQQLYWNSNEFSGNSDLTDEEIREARGRVNIKLFKTLDVGIRGQIKDIRNGIMVGSDSVFTNLDPYNSLSVTPYFDLNSSLFELSGSATYHQFGHFVGSSSQPLPLDGSKRVWLKGSAYIKGYLFDRATYIKAGLAGMISPFRYRAAHYNPVLDFWQPLSDDQFLPAFDRLDVDISARIRDIMIVLRWENVLDDISQFGYFESAGYPMTQRRFIFGVRTFFRN